MTEPTVTTEQDVKAVFQALKAWIGANRPDPEDYWDHSFPHPSNADGQRAYREDLREVQKEERRARRALKLAQSYPANPAALQDALTHAYSGRLSWVKREDGTGALSYCAGQNYDTEATQAAAAVLEEYADTCRPKYSPPTGFQPYTVTEIKHAAKAAGSHTLTAPQCGSFVLACSQASTMALEGATSSPPSSTTIAHRAASLSASSTRKTQTSTRLVRLTN